MLQRITANAGLTVDEFSGIQPSRACSRAQGTSRALAEELPFDRAKVTSVDWLSYPSLNVTEVRGAVDILINARRCRQRGRRRPGRSVIANDVFDTTDALA